MVQLSVLFYHFTQKPGSAQPSAIHKLSGQLSTWEEKPELDFTARKTVRCKIGNIVPAQFSMAGWWESTLKSPKVSPGCGQERHILVIKSSEPGMWPWKHPEKCSCRHVLGPGLKAPGYPLAGEKLPQ